MDDDRVTGPCQQLHAGSAGFPTQHFHVFHKSTGKSPAKIRLLSNSSPFSQRKMFPFHISRNGDNQLQRRIRKSVGEYTNNSRLVNQSIVMSSRQDIQGDFPVCNIQYNSDISDLCGLQNLSKYIRNLRGNFYCFLIWRPKILSDYTI